MGTRPVVFFPVCRNGMVAAFRTYVTPPCILQRACRAKGDVCFGVMLARHVCGALFAWNIGANA